MCYDILRANTNIKAQLSARRIRPLKLCVPQLHLQFTYAVWINNSCIPRLSITARICLGDSCISVSLLKCRWEHCWDSSFEALSDLYLINMKNKNKKMRLRENHKSALHKEEIISLFQKHTVFKLFSPHYSSSSVRRKWRSPVKTPKVINLSVKII